MKKLKTIFLFFAFALILALGFSCKKKDEVKEYQNKMIESLKTVQKIKSDLVVTDNDVVVYEYLKELNFTSDSNAQVIETTKTLDQSFNLREEIITDTIQNVDKSKLLSINLTKGNFNSYSIDNQNFTGEISKEKISNVFNESIVIKDVAKMMIYFENNVVVKMECTYLTETNKTVKITTTYEY